MLSEKFSYIAIGYGVICFTVLLLAGIERFRRGRIVGSQFCIALFLVISWFLSNFAVITVPKPTVNDLSFPYIDTFGAAVMIAVMATYREQMLWMRGIATLTYVSLFFHIPYLMTDGTIMSKYAYHLTENMIFLTQNILTVLGLYIKRSRWMQWGAAIEWEMGRKFTRALSKA